ncbi:DUF5776 domain-containing protein [Levilactobacillus brevis]|uniref:DUF5776 domain-containing protein n=1 Tax=Levilactobacillus brevis TaxID=1580 RepID=UPI003985A880
MDSFPAGTVFAIAKVVTYGKITRFQLANGYYITSNQTNVNRLYYSVDGGVKRVKSVRGTHRYKDKALKHVVDWQPAGLSLMLLRSSSMEIQLGFSWLMDYLLVATKRLTNLSNERIVQDIPVRY